MLSEKKKPEDKVILQVKYSIYVTIENILWK